MGSAELAGEAAGEGRTPLVGSRGGDGGGHHGRGHGEGVDALRRPLRISRDSVSSYWPINGSRTSALS